MSDPSETAALVVQVANNLPPVVRQNAVASFNALVGAALDVPIAWFERTAATIRAKTDVETEIVRAHGAAAAELLARDPELLERTKRSFTDRLYRSQINREAIAQKTEHELRDAQPTEDATKQIDPDWLDVFSRIAETKSNEEMQAYFARLLAGEIRSPGAFSAATVEVLARLSPDVATAFGELCNISSVWTLNFTYLPPSMMVTGVITSPYGNPGNNALQPLKFPFTRLRELQDAGLIQSDLNVTSNLNVGVLPFTVLDCAGQQIRFRPTDTSTMISVNDASKIFPVGLITFTRAGRELRRIINIDPNLEYVEKIREWLATNLAPHNLAIR